MNSKSKAFIPYTNVFSVNQKFLKNMLLTVDAETPPPLAHTIYSHNVHTDGSLSSGFKTVRLPSCVFHKRSVFLLLNLTLSLNPILKFPYDFRSAFPKSQVPYNAEVFRLVAQFHETIRENNRKYPCPPTVLIDMSVENIR
jgi:hypothetical protein